MLMEHSKPILIEDINYVEQGPFPYPNPMKFTESSEQSKEPFLSLFNYVEDKIVQSSTFQKMKIKLRKGIISSMTVREWEGSYDVRFESFNLIEGTNEFIFCEIHANTGCKDLISGSFNPKIFKILCFKLLKTEDELSNYPEEALHKVENGKWADWVVEEILENYKIFDYSFFNPEQDSVTLKIKDPKTNITKIVLIPFTIEEMNSEVYPAGLYEIK